MDEAMQDDGLDREACRQAQVEAGALVRLGEAIRTDIRAGRMYGASVAVARGGRLLYHAAIGEAAPGRPARTDDIYLLMSLSKSFTAALVLQAIERGWFGLDDRVADWWPAFGAAGKQDISVRQLLTHCAGMPTGLMPPVDVPPAQIGDLALFAGALATLPPLYPPGSQVFYSPTAAYAVLGQLLVLTDPQGRAFRDIARQQLFEPLGMRDTSFGMRPDAARRVPMSYTPAMSTLEGQAVAGLLNHVLGERAELPAGGALSTLDDVLRFAEAMRQEGRLGDVRVLSAKVLREACRSHTGSARNMGWEGYRQEYGLAETPAHYSLLGGQVRGGGQHLSAAGRFASAGAFYSVGRGSTLWMVDPERELSFVFLGAGVIEGLAHTERLSRLSDLVTAACQ
ncbi:CubicO group peptidase (beta-lactamase class C family) [Kerstersia gyiorum]|uniref:serine hydrolase domain-containing protein n=1 Tax=Kerstersia gyiorum TaxID=206506 RepID=UPI0020A1652B|nr:serine hydrolase domain-containing protein [Kerstersia gyiorum]MCP1712328.1 CubicO group peptidase (beta-lactamase class C family) [Kerstersia gyiorum]